MLCILIPGVWAACYYLFDIRQYYLIGLIMIVLSLLPFFVSLERKKLRTGELVITASVIAVAVASRAAFFYLPNIKPMCALLIIFAISFGAEFGFLTGALSMLLSNFIYGQGIWTPFQMFAMGITVFVCALLFRTLAVKNRLVLGIISGVLCFLLYGAIVDISSVLTMVSDYNLKSVLAVYASGVPFNLVHGLTTGVCVTLFYPVLYEKNERIKIKYGLFGECDEKNNIS